MAVKSILDIGVDDKEFQRFSGAFQNYQKLLKTTPAEWAKTVKGIGQGRAEFDALVKQQIAVLARQKLMAQVETAAQKTLEKSEKSWRGIASYTKDVGRNLLNTTGTLLKWASIGTGITGLLGIGGLFGVDTLARGIGAGRRESLGLGIPYGARQAFNITAGRVLGSPEQFLSAIMSARTDPTQRLLLNQLGAAGAADTGTAAVTVLENLKRLADRTPTAQLGNLFKIIPQLSNLATPQDVLAIKNTPAAEFGEYIKTLGAGIKGPGKDVQRAFQDLDTQLRTAGTNIENAFVIGLGQANLPEELSSLSKYLTDTVTSFMNGPEAGQLIKDLKTVIKNFADSLKSGEFKANVKLFMADIGTLAHGIDWLIDKIPGLKTFEAAGAGVIGFAEGGPVGAVAGVGIDLALQKAQENAAPVQAQLRRQLMPPNMADISPPAYGRLPLSPLFSLYGGSTAFDPTNPGNLRLPGSTRFQHFQDADTGLRKMIWQLQRYQDAYHLNTIRDIVSRYAPKGENDTAAYISAVAARTGFGATQSLDLHNQSVLAKLVSAMTKQENVKNNYSPQMVLKVMNVTGGSAVVSAAALP